MAPLLAGGACRLPLPSSGGRHPATPASALSFPCVLPVCLSSMSTCPHFIHRPWELGPRCHLTGHHPPSSSVHLSSITCSLSPPSSSPRGLWTVPGAGRWHLLRDLVLPPPPLRLPASCFRISLTLSEPPCQAPVCLSRLEQRPQRRGARSSAPQQCPLGAGAQ